jgi:hypothetical protein
MDDEELRAWVAAVLEHAAKRASRPEILEAGLGLAVESGILRAELIALRDHGTKALKEPNLPL